ncbi:MAG: chemotaxis protein CheW [Leptolyngbya sp. Prado105]|jgi:chemotaxis-related protein WspB|nr:chemotaxis protein CheW [Leptolyngbya sp. Prado105]
MLLLLFYLEENLYAIETSNILEVVPMVILRRIQSAQSSAIGFFNYRENIAPVVDLRALICGQPSQVCYRTRILMAQNPATSKSIGFIAERVTETFKVSDPAAKMTESTSNSPVLGKLFLTEKGMIQMINIQHLMSNTLTAISLEEKDGEGCKTPSN